MNSIAKMMMAKSVCIVGGGPAGIVAAKTLLRDHPKDTFDVTVFEQSERIGGLWPLSDDDDGIVNPQMCTNLSRHTVSFSDLAWPESSPTFPKAWQVGQYLKRYVDKYRVDVRTSSTVVNAMRSKEAVEKGKRWKVEVRTSSRSSTDPNPLLPQDRNSQSHITNGFLETYYFDHLIVASGFFSKPKFPAAFKDSKKLAAVVQHSSEFRTIKDLLKNVKDPSDHGGKIVVVGGSMSGAEVAASIATQLSSEMYSPSAANINGASKYSVHHVIKRPFWVMPLFLPSNTMTGEAGSKSFNPASPFLPLDLVMYDLASRPPGPLTNKSGRITPEAANMTNNFFQSLAGSDQSEVHFDHIDGKTVSSLAIQGDIRNEAPWLAISDGYKQFVDSGQISVAIGTLKSISPQDGSSIAKDSVIVLTGTQEHVIDDVAAVVLATGFESSISIDFLEEEVLKTLQHDPNCGPFPLVLNIHSTINQSIPDLGFVGFYRGPYWGVMEMQSRFLGNLWSGDKNAANALIDDVTNIPDLRKCYYEDSKQLQQFPMGDYTYLMESFNTILNNTRIGEARAGPVLPARYITPNASSPVQEESTSALSSVGRTLNGATQGRFIARAVFTAMQGTWNIYRSLISSIASYPSGKFEGKARFLPRAPTDDYYDSEYLYVEEGDFETENGMKFSASRRYAHRYNEETDTLSVWFVKTDNKTVDYLFHELEILPPEDGSGWRARSHHLCIKDTYDVIYEFRFRGVMLEHWTLKYSVKGPSKDYRIESRYWR